MYISEVKLWNFRKYGSDSFDLDKPNLVIPFKKGMNVLVGENDSGKTAIIDAIKYVLKTNAYEVVRVEHEDFYNESDRLRIEVLIEEMSDEEGRNFTEVISPIADEDYCQLRLILDVRRDEGRILPYEVCAGSDESGHQINAVMKYNIAATYLKPLRDAEKELTAKRNSRLSQILRNHELLKEYQGGEKHKFIEIIETANREIGQWFEGGVEEKSPQRNQIKDVIDYFLKQFVSKDTESEFYLLDPTMKSILEKIAIGVVDQYNLGLGTLNRLFMSTELLHLRKSGDNLRVCLIEELEAHLHPQVQLKVIEGLLKEDKVQFIITTHSPNITSQVKLGANGNTNNIIRCHSNQVFPMGKEYTKLDKRDYIFLDRFLDVTKSNLFFAKGVIIVEGWAEEILIPAIARKMGIDLIEHEISIVNVGSTAYLHFARIFMRNNDSEMDIKCAVITDLDVKPDEENRDNKEEQKRNSIKNSLGEHSSNIKVFIAKEWTLEWCLFKSTTLKAFFMDATSKVHNRTHEFMKSEESVYNKEQFEEKFEEKLKDKSLDKVAIANELAIAIDSSTIKFDNNDSYINYIVDAIKFFSETDEVF